MPLVPLPNFDAGLDLEQKYKGRQPTCQVWERKVWSSRRLTEVEIGSSVILKTGYSVLTSPKPHTEHYEGADGDIKTQRHPARLGSLRCS